MTGQNFPDASYLGGASGLKRDSDQGELGFQDRGITFGGNFLSLTIPWDEISRVNFEDATQAKSRWGAVALVGVWALAAKDREPGAAIEVVVSDGERIYFHIRKSSVQRVKALTGDLLRQHGVAEEPPTSKHGSAPTNEIDALERLAKLHTDGALTTAEFTAAKAKLLDL